MASLVELASLARGDDLVAKSAIKYGREARAAGRAARRAYRNSQQPDRSMARWERQGQKLSRLTEPTVNNIKEQSTNAVRDIGDAATKATASIGAAGTKTAADLERITNLGTKRASRNVGIGLGAGLAGGVSVPVAVNHALGAARDRSNRRRRSS